MDEMPFVILPRDKIQQSLHEKIYTFHISASSFLFSSLLLLLLLLLLKDDGRTDDHNQYKFSWRRGKRARTRGPPTRQQTTTTIITTKGLIIHSRRNVKTWRGLKMPNALKSLLSFQSIAFFFVSKRTLF